MALCLIPIGAAALVVLLVWLFTPRALEATVARTRWFHIVRAEERVVVHDEGWGSPVGAFNESCRSKYQGTEPCNPRRCNPHPETYVCGSYSCNCRTSCSNKGNGFSSCTESCSTCSKTCTRTVYSTCHDRCPVYRRWCSYDIHRWLARGERSLSGDDPKTMAWPDLGPEDETHRLIRVPAYIVEFTAGPDRYTYAPDTADDFTRFTSGQVWHCEKSIAGPFKPLRRQ